MSKLENEVKVLDNTELLKLINQNFNNEDSSSLNLVLEILRNRLFPTDSMYTKWKLNPGHMPVERNDYVEIECKNGTRSIDKARYFRWEIINPENLDNIIMYRVN